MPNLIQELIPITPHATLAPELPIYIKTYNEIYSIT